MIACPSDIRAAIRVYYLGEEPASSPGLAQVVAPQIVPPAAPSSETSVEAKAAPPPPPPRPRAVPDSRAQDSGDRESIPSSESTPAASTATAPAPEIQAKETEVLRPRRARPKMISLTLLDGTSISIPGPPKQRGSKPEIPVPKQEAGEALSDQLTARDLVSALRAVAHGVDASDILGTEPRWEAMFSALLSILLRKGLIADWEFVEEFRKI
jgi:type IV pilus assembly protein PilB